MQAPPPRKKRKILLPALLLLALAAFLLWRFAPGVLFDSALPAVPFGAPSSLKIQKSLPSLAFASSGVPEAAEAELAQARDLRLSGALSGAAPVYERLLLQAPQSATVLWGAAYSLLAQGAQGTETGSKNARNYAERLESLAPQSAQSLVLRSLLAEQDGNLTAALDASLRAVRAQDDLPEAHLRKAQMLLAAGRHAEAAFDAQVGVSLSQGRDPRYFSALAQSYWRRNLLDSCENLVNYAISRFPTEKSLLLYDGYFREFKGDFDGAERNYRKILALAPGDSEAVDALGTIGQKRRPSGDGASPATPRERMADAIAILEPLAQRYPENLPLREALGLLYLKAQNAGGARRLFGEIAEQDPAYPEIRSRLFEAEQMGVEHKNYANASLADSLQRELARARQEAAGSQNEAPLGHYLVRYGASPKEFFAQYPASRFKKQSKWEWTEEAKDGRYSVYFGKTGFYAVRALLRLPFSDALRENTGLVGDGRKAETFACDSTEYQAVLWQARDNFELLMRRTDSDTLTYLLRLEPSRANDGGNLCSYLPMLHGKNVVVRPIPRNP